MHSLLEDANFASSTGQANQIKRVNSGKLKASNKITPDGLLLTISSISLKEKDILELNISLSRDKLNFPAVLYLIFVFGNKEILYQSIVIGKEVSEYTLDIRLNNMITKNLGNSSNVLLYGAVIGDKINREEIFWTSTSTIEWMDLS